MAFYWNGALKADAKALVEASWPFLVKKFVVVADGTDAEEALHGEDRAPDMVLITNVSADPAATSMSSQAPTSAATQVKIDAEAAATGHVYMIWFSQASGGLSNVS